jgi:hypothetical protein
MNIQDFLGSENHDLHHCMSWHYCY